MSGETRKENLSVTLAKNKQAGSLLKILELMFFPSFCKLCGLFKYQKFKVLAKELAAYMYRSLVQDEALWWDLEAVIPVPLHKARKRQRGFNQSYELARYIADFKGLELLDKALIKKFNVPPQTSLSAEERKINNRGAYEVVDPWKIKGKILLLVDDVYTTGATVSECSAVLLKSGAREVRVVTLAQAS